MTTYWNCLGDVISQIWSFMWNTNLPNTRITFGGLYISLIVLSIVCSVLGFIVRRKGENK